MGKVPLVIPVMTVCFYFGGIKQWFAGGVARYRGIEKMHTQNLMEAICYNLYRLLGIVASNSQKMEK